VTHEDPNELRPSLSADVLTEHDRTRQAVRDRQQACHHFYRTLDGVVDPEARIAQPDMGSDPPRFPGCSCRKVVGGRERSCHARMRRGRRLSGRRLAGGPHSKGAPPCEPAGGHARCAFGPGSGRDPDVPAWDDDQKPSPVAGRRLLSSDNVYGAGRFASGHAARRRKRDESGVLTGTSGLELLLRSVRRLPTGSAPVRFQSGNSRDFAVNAGHGGTRSRGRSGRILQGYSALHRVPRSACHAEGRGFESLQPLPRRPAFAGLFASESRQCDCVTGQ
jgi:hypothetical protein